MRNKITGPQTPRLRRLGNKRQVIYKHAISTIIPVHPVPLNDPGLPSEAHKRFAAGKSLGTEIF